MTFLQKIALFLLSQKEPKKNKKQFVSWNKLSKVLIVAYDNQLSNNLVNFISTCQKDNISAHVVIIYYGKIEQAPKPYYEHTILDKKQFSLFQLPKESSLQKLNATNYDLLINLGSQDQIQALALSKLVTAKCKTASFQNSIFDLTIDYDKTTNSSDYLNQVVVYLNMIKTTV